MPAGNNAKADGPGDVGDSAHDRAGNDAGDSALDRSWRQLPDSATLFSQRDTLGRIVLALVTTQA